METQWDHIEKGSYSDVKVPDVGELCSVPLSNSLIIIGGMIYVALAFDSLLVDLSFLYDIIGKRRE